MKVTAPSTPARNPVVLITGASTGLGLALGRRLIRNGGYHVILTAREGSLTRFQSADVRESERVWLRPMDVTSASQRQRVVQEANDLLGGIDVLVNNAAVAFRSVLEHVSETDWKEQMRVNFLASAELSRLVLPGMRARSSGRIIAISSVGGMMAMPTMALYSASKFALEGAFEALWYEVRLWGIRVTLVEPGFLRSDSFEKTQFTQNALRARDDAADPYHAHYAHMGGFIARWMMRAWSQPDDVARVVERVMSRKRPPLRVYATPDAWLFAILRRMLPRGLYHHLLYTCLPGVRNWGRLPAVPETRPDVAPAIAQTGEARSSAPERR
jgi:NAD(P)-dependent dehydrogenase (short-subunit alcohol dehydrogenase family)